MNINADKKRLIPKNNDIFAWCLGFVQALFPVLLFTYLVLVLIEILFEGSVSAYLNLNYLLIVVIIAGVAVALSTPVLSDNGTMEPASNRNRFFMICAGIGGAIIILYKTSDIGWISYVISAFGGGSIIFLTSLIWHSDEGEDIEKPDNQDN